MWRMPRERVAKVEKKELRHLEKTILACLLQKPELMSKLRLKDEHFTNYQRLWKFMTNFYAKYKSFDINLMYAVCDRQQTILCYIIELAEADVFTAHFDEYQDQFLELFDLSFEEKFLIDKVYELATKLFTSQITIEEFDTEYVKLSNKIVKRNNKEGD